MTETEKKFSDAATQLSLAMTNHGNEQVVRSCINAVIDQGRSVTFVMQAESGEPGRPLRDWYDEQMKMLLASPRGGVLRFFNDRRVHTVHRGVVDPQHVVAPAFDLKVNGRAVNSESTTVAFCRFEGVREFILTDRSGGVFRLCDQYLSLLRSLVDGWLAKRAELGIH